GGDGQRDALQNFGVAEPQCEIPDRQISRGSRLTGEAAPVQEGLLFGRGSAPEHGVAVRKAAEATDDVGMNVRPFEAVGVARGLIAQEPALLVDQTLGMLERQIEETAHLGIGAVEAVEDGAARQRARLRVGGEGALVAAEHVARKLVEQDQQRQRAFGAVFPRRQLAGGGGLMQRQEAPADFVVERRILLAPALRSDIAPERHDLGGLGCGLVHGRTRFTPPAARPPRRAARGAKSCRHWSWAGRREIRSAWAPCSWRAWRSGKRATRPPPVPAVS